MSALTAADIILRPVISEKSIDVSTLTDRNPRAGNKYTFAVHRDANKIQIKAAIEELYAKEKVTVVSVNVLTTKPKEKRRGTKRGRILGWTDALAQGDRHPGPRPEDRILRGGLTMPLRSYKPTSPGRRFMTRSTFEEITTDEPYKPLLEPQKRGSGRNNAGPAHRPPSRRRREAALPPDRLQARQARRARPARDDRVRPEPVGPHRPALLPRRREALHAPAARPEGRRRGRVRPRGRGARRQCPAARQHPARHDDPQHRARPGQGRPDRPVRRDGRPAPRQGGRLRPGPAARRARCAASRCAAWPRSAR